MPTPSPATANDMAPELSTGRAFGRVSDQRFARVVRGVALLAVACSACAAAWAQTPRAPIYDCIDANGKRIRSDRPIADCRDKEQRELNPDGSVKRVVPPTPTADERSNMEQRERELNAERAARNDAIRRDRNLISRYPDEAAHAKGRAKALDDIRNAVRISEARINLLKAERKPLMDEAEFYVGKPLPNKLKSALDSNDASLEAQKALVQNQEVEIVRINNIFDAELARLKKLWAGAPAGSLGPIAPASQPAGTKAAPK